MVGKKHEQEAERSPTEELRENERYQPDWVRKYLDLADLLMRKRKHKQGDDKPKAA